MIPMVAQLPARVLTLTHDPDTITTICTHVASGGTLITLCEVWDVPFGMISSWIHEDKDRNARYISAINDRSEFEVERIKHEFGRIGFAPLGDEDVKTAEKLKALELMSRINGLFRDKVEHSADETLASLIERSMVLPVEPPDPGHGGNLQ